MSENLTSEEALSVMRCFLEMYWERGMSEEIAMLLGSLMLMPDGKCADRALSEDWEECVHEVIKGRPHG